MKNPERVAELLAELRALTKTDFERHRLDVLERDLTAPPTVEVIDDTHQRFDGITYGKNGGGHFTLHLSIHRAVWSYYHGEIPAGYEIHHIDENKANNALGNLQKLTKSAHQSIHKKNQKRGVYICQFCGKKYTAKNHSKKNRFCSVTCRNKWKNQNDREIRICENCGKPFSARTSSSTRSCSGHCAQILQWREKKHAVEKTCPVCGKTFKLRYKNSPQIYCSRACVNKIRHKE